MNYKLTFEKIYEQETEPLNKTFHVPTLGSSKAYYFLFQTVEESLLQKIFEKSLEMASKEPSSIDEIRDQLTNMYQRFKQDFEPVNKGYL